MKSTKKLSDAIVFTRKVRNSIQLGV